MNVEIVKARALATAKGASSIKDTDSPEAFRVEAGRFFSKMLPPPLYRRRDEPQRALAVKWTVDAEALLVRAYRLAPAAELKDFTEALELYTEVACLVADGRVEAAERPWSLARELAQKATAPTRLWLKPNLTLPKVFDKRSLSSRFDPRSAESAQVKLTCPQCRKLSTFFVPHQQSRHLLSCPSCKVLFSAFLAEVMAIEAGTVAKKKQYRFALRDLGGLQSQLVVDDAGDSLLPVERNDLVAFLFLPESSMRAVLNLTSSRVLWLSQGGACFLATVVFGEGAFELETFRHFRDRHLLTRWSGRQFVKAYYCHGPALARVVEGRAPLKRATALALTAVHRLLLWSLKEFQ